MAFECAFIQNVAPGSPMPPDSAWRKIGLAQSQRLAAGEDRGGGDPALVFLCVYTGGAICF
eukprot:1137019-Pyramimonas_sp.AAC.1